MGDTFLSLPLRIDEKATVVCSHHSLLVCSQCNLDFTALNQTYKVFGHLPTDLKCPPPPTKQPHIARATQIAKLRDSGNQSLKLNKFDDAIRYYGLAIEMSLARPPWELAAICRDEVVVCLVNRSMVRLQMGDFPEAFADAETIVQLKKNWVKGYVRKAQALQGMGRLEEAKMAIDLGLMYDQNDNECNLASKDIKQALEAFYSTRIKPSSS